jgi:hypothetical protein
MEEVLWDGLPAPRAQTPDLTSLSGSSRRTQASRDGQVRAGVLQADIHIMLRVRPRSTWRRTTRLREVAAEIMERTIRYHFGSSQPGVSNVEIHVR